MAKRSTRMPSGVPSPVRIRGLWDVLIYVLTSAECYRRLVVFVCIISGFALVMCGLLVSLLFVRAADIAEIIKGITDSKLSR